MRSLNLGLRWEEKSVVWQSLLLSKSALVRKLGGYPPSHRFL
jgi:hypothetical protein